MIDDGAAKAHLHEHLRWVREALVWKLDGLSDAEVRRPLTASGPCPWNSAPRWASLQA